MRTGWHAGRLCTCSLPHNNRSPSAACLSSYWRRLIEHRTASAGAQQRFVETMDFFFQAITMQAIDRKRGSIPDLESYISDRRETSGCKPCFALIEYANNLRIPDEVIDHPCIRALCEAANDLVWGSNVGRVAYHLSLGNIHRARMRDRTYSLTTWSKRAVTPRTT